MQNYMRNDSEYILDRGRSDAHFLSNMILGGEVNGKCDHSFIIL